MIFSFFNNLACDCPSCVHRRICVSCVRSVCPTAPTNHFLNSGTHKWFFFIIAHMDQHPSNAGLGLNICERAKLNKCENGRQNGSNETSIRNPLPKFPGCFMYQKGKSRVLYQRRSCQFCVLCTKLINVRRGTGLHLVFRERPPIRQPPATGSPGNSTSGSSAAGPTRLRLASPRKLAFSATLFLWASIRLLARRMQASAPGQRAGESTKQPF